MNKQYITLESSTTSYSIVLDELLLDDHTELFLNVSNIYNNMLVLYMRIDWGDAHTQIYENDIYVIDEKDVNALTYNPVLSKPYSHQYYPSDKALYKSLTAQVAVGYSNGDTNLFTLPIKIRTYDYFESIYDLELHSLDIIPSYPQKLKYSFIEKKNNYLVSMQ